MFAGVRGVLGVLVSGLLLLIGVCSAPAYAVAQRPFADLPLAAQATISATVARESEAYQVRHTRTGYRARNAAHALEADFGAAGVRVCTPEAGCARLTLASYGRADSRRHVVSVAPKARANRVEYRRGDVTEWYVNGPMGVEQGFTLAAAPPGLGQAPVTLALRLGGGVSAAAEDDGVRLVRADGRTVARYRGLSAVDATGRELPVRLETRGQQVLLRVDDCGARYPVVIDPFIQTAKLTTSDGAISDEFGKSVAISGNTVVVGADNAKIGSNVFQGAVYVFVKPATGWATMIETAKLTASDGAAGDSLGAAVAIDGDTIVAGAPTYYHPSYIGNGAVYVFVKPGAGWVTTTETAKLTASDGVAGDDLGISVGISADTVVASAPAATIGSNASQGAVYVFVRPATGWTSTTEAAKLTTSDGAAYDRLWSVAIRGQTVAAGVPFATINSNAAQGAVYVFMKPGTGWATMTETAKLTASDGGPNDSLGLGPFSVAVGDDMVVAGADRATIDGDSGRGAAYVFVRPGTGWATMTETAKLTASDGAAGAGFGFSVAVGGDTIVVGAFTAAVGANDQQGAVYLFVEPWQNWVTTTETAKLTAADGMAGDRLGTSVGMVGNTVVAGAFFATYSNGAGKGAAYIFQRETVTPAPAASPAGLLVLMLLLSCGGAWGLYRRS